ncbi:MAG: sugar ABC transporter permease [Candidatus Dactylopiibacterium carminicum]|uniref:ABC transporter permease n=1 Tax=Candidatus Dactylopiibacterium carminicum TaxID=857335 RepID=A0A272ES29_9RHOO|nr:ABC transporter permease [Candidatus Dactylopiibacterium carminicum]KAF7598693.1 ABC transporter permease [Candidatus Dactylopiibacterium carminicum]PAS92510.1 MAG: sugar ABC transporter permease [Candidatus Dactylopiibacterium carminicum]PAS96307.1 MAG: sugar ABC transporter permease [Candidatus Dactylopiibacterium carminicum]PAS98560.1 MAG: sugar ABC transporter permease [Candidatus Dactylopiibacterium carminicum]
MQLLEPRDTPSRLMRWAAPVLAILLTLVSAAILFAALGKPPLQAFHVFFIEPLQTANGWSELALKASPLILIALGLALGFRARIYNIGAEGQLLVGAIFASGVAIHTDGMDAWWILPAMVLAGAIGGGLWGAIPAWLRTRFNASETLTTLMLTYVATYLLSWLVSGPWRDPGGTNFPQSILFSEAAMFAPLFEGLRINTSVFLTLVAVPLFWLFVAKSFLAFQLAVGGEAPAAARYAGFSASRTVWLSLVISGVTAGIAGAAEAAGPVGQLTLSLSPGYGFAAIIVAWVGRLHPVGIVLAGLLLALIYLGGESAQIAMQLPAAISWLFQGMLLFFLLGADAFVDHRLRRRRVRNPQTEAV